MRVLIISANFFPMVPTGAAYIAGAALKAGHSVEVFDCFTAKNLIEELKEKIERFKPQIVGISILVVCGDIVDKSKKFYTKYFDNRPVIKKIVNCIKQNSDSRIVLGGPGFNYYGKDWLEYLDLDYGIRGESEFSFPRYLNEIEKKGDIFNIPGCIYRKDRDFYKVQRELVEDLDDTAFPAYELFDLSKYTSFGIFTKRGCTFNCSFCPYSSLEGTKYRMKSPKRVVDEIEHVLKKRKAGFFNFTDNCFNFPKQHAEKICQELIDRNLTIRWWASNIKPIGITDDFCRLLKESGCNYVTLAIETASEKMLKSMNRGYNITQIKNALTCFSNSNITFGVTILIGAHGETPETIAETFSIIDNFPKIHDVWVSIGICLWTKHQKILDDARKSGQLQDDRELFECGYYIPPELPKKYMVEFIESINSKKNFQLQVNKPFAEYQKVR